MKPRKNKQPNESDINILNDSYMESNGFQPLSVDEKIKYVSGWLRNARDELKRLKREQHHHEYDGPFLSVAAQSYIELKKSKGEEVSQEEIQELKQYAGNEKLWFLKRNIAQQEITIESLRSKLEHWQNMKEVDHLMQGNEKKYGHHQEHEQWIANTWKRERKKLDSNNKTDERVQKLYKKKYGLSISKRQIQRFTGRE